MRLLLGWGLNPTLTEGGRCAVLLMPRPLCGGWASDGLRDFFAIRFISCRHRPRFCVCDSPGDADIMAPPENQLDR